MNLLTHFQPNIFRFSDVFRRYRSGILVENRLKENGQFIRLALVRLSNNCLLKRPVKNLTRSRREVVEIEELQRIFAE